MAEEQEVKVNEPKKRGRPAKVKTPDTDTTKKAVSDNVAKEETIPIEKEEEVVIVTEPKESYDVGLENIINDIPEESEIIEVEEVIDETDGYTLNYKFRRGETVWVANWGHKLETDIYGFCKDIWKFRPLKLTVKSIILEDRLFYKFFGYDKQVEESHIKRNYDQCKNLCDGLNL
jgi:hypothetical protein